MKGLLFAHIQLLCQAYVFVLDNKKFEAMVKYIYFFFTTTFTFYGKSFINCLMVRRPIVLL